MAVATLRALAGGVTSPGPDQGAEFGPGNWAVLWAVRDNDWPMIEKTAYAMLFSRWGTNGQPRPSWDRLAADMGASREGAKEAIRQLAARGVVGRRGRAADNGVSLSNTFRLWPPWGLDTPEQLAARLAEVRRWEAGEGQPDTPYRTPQTPLPDTTDPLQGAPHTPEVLQFLRSTSEDNQEKTDPPVCREHSPA